jgi:hypothetical protein
MAKRVVTKVGDVFCANIDGKHKRYLQYIVSDLTQLNSDVVRVFKEKYPIDAEPKLDEVVKGEVDFYVHCVVSGGVKRGLWEKVGKCADVGDIENIIFKDKGEYNREEQDDWYIWKINQDFIPVSIDNLKRIYKNSYFGIVLTPETIYHKLKFGIYYGFAAKYE